MELQDQISLMNYVRVNLLSKIDVSDIQYAIEQIKSVPNDLINKDILTWYRIRKLELHYALNILLWDYFPQNNMEKIEVVQLLESVMVILMTLQIGESK